MRDIPLKNFFDRTFCFTINVLKKLVFVLFLFFKHNTMYLNCKTYFSFHYGTYSTEELVNEGAEKGVRAMALTNINTTCDAWDFVQCCREKNIKPVLGVEVRNGSRLLYILLARNNRGFRWINEFVSGHMLEKKDFPDGAEAMPF